MHEWLDMDFMRFCTKYCLKKWEIVLAESKESFWKNFYIKCFRKRKFHIWLENI